MGQQVLDGHGRIWLNEFLPQISHPPQHFGFAESGDVFADWLKKLKFALFAQHHQGDGRDGFGHAVDAEDGVFFQRQLLFHIAEAAGFIMKDLPFACNQADKTGRFLLVYIFLHSDGDIVQTVG